MARPTSWNYSHRHGHHFTPKHHPSFGKFLGILFGLMMLVFLFRTGMVFFVIMLVGLVMIKGASKVGGAMCTQTHDDDLDEDIETYLKRKNDDLYDESDKRKNDDDIAYF